MSCFICSYKCRGYDNNHGDCCNANNGDWILGPHTPNDITEFLTKLGNDITHEDIFIDYEEGSKLFPDKHVWQRHENYPALRVNMNSEKKFCIFYDENKRICSVYDSRPRICRNYECSYLKNNKEGPK